MLTGYGTYGTICIVIACPGYGKDSSCPKKIPCALEKVQGIFYVKKTMHPAYTGYTVLLSFLFVMPTLLLPVPLLVETVWRIQSCHFPLTPRGCFLLHNTCLQCHYKMYSQVQKQACNASANTPYTP